MARAKRQLKAKPPPAQVDSTPVFPESAFIGLFADYRELVGPTTEAPDAFHWASLLASLSALVGRTAKLEGGPDGVTPLVHVALLGRTGKARKSTAMEDAISLFVDALPAALEAQISAPVQLKVVDGDHIRAAPARSSAPAADAFDFTLDVVRGAGSGEGLAEALADKDDDSGKRALFVIDEFGALLEKAGRGQAGNLVELLLRLYDAPTRFEHRTRKASFTVTNGVGVFLGASTVEWVHRTLTEAHVRRGLVSRFIWVLGDRKPKPLARRPAIDSERHQAFLALAAERLSSAARAKTFALTSEADALHQRRYELEYHRDDESDLQAAASARADGLALRLSLLLAIAEGAKKVGLGHIEAAWAVVDYSRQVSSNLIEHIGTKSRAGAESRILNAAMKASAATRGLFSRRDVFQRVKGSTGVSSDVFERGWKALVANGELIEAPPNKWKLAGK